MSNAVVNGVVVTATGNSAGFGVLSGKTLALQLTAAAVGGTTPSLTVEVQWSMDGTTWASADGTPDTFAAITANKSTTKQFAVKGQYYRLAYTVSGTTPTFTVTATEQQLN